MTARIPPQDEGPDRDPPVIDLGLAAERTRLAWNRTALALLVVGLLMLHPFHLPSGEVEPVTLVSDLPGFALLVLAAATWWYGGRRYRSVTAAVRDGRAIPVVLARSRYALVTLVPAALALCVILL